MMTEQPQPPAAYSAADEAKAAPHPAETGLEESMWRLELGVSVGAADAVLPERPGEPDCGYFLRTGVCGYGDRCRYNHPRDRGASFPVGGQAFEFEFPERSGQPICEYYMKHGTCKFGASCKYHHPRQNSTSMHTVVLNTVGYPLRLGEKECSYYMKTGQCKFGYTCKFHHPEPGNAPMNSTALGVYPPVQTSSLPSPSPYMHLASWPVGRPAVMPGNYIPGSYGPMMVSPGAIPLQGWSSYMPQLKPAMPISAQQALQARPLHGMPHQGSPSALGYSAPYVPLSSSIRPLTTNERENLHPERPGQPDCQYYLKTGECKFGEACKYHHPRDNFAPMSNCFLSPIGLPMRPGAQSCAYYAQHGFCRFGPTCKFDHPVSSISYSPSASSLAEMPMTPYPLSYLVANFASSSSSPDLRQEYLLTQEASANSADLSESTPASVMSKGMFSSPHSFIHSQTATASGNSSASHVGER